MNLLLHVEIPGKPAGQGSMALWTGGDGKERVKYPPATVAHRNLAVGMIRQVWGLQGPYLSPVALDLYFYMPRPMSHFGTGRNEGQVKASAPAYPVLLGRDDLDKKIRLIGDALVIAGVLKDDSQICDVRARKVWEPDASNGHTSLRLKEMH